MRQKSVTAKAPAEQVGKDRPMGIKTICLSDFYVHALVNPKKFIQKRRLVPPIGRALTVEEIEIGPADAHLFRR